MSHLQEYLRSGVGQAVLLTFAGTAALQGSIAIWAATSRVHWFGAALAVWGGIMLLLPIRLYEPAAVFAVASPLIIATVAAASWIRRWRDPSSTKTEFRFGLRDLFFLLLLVALVIVGVQSIPPRLDVGHVGSIGHSGRARRHDRVAGLRLRREPLATHFRAASGGGHSGDSPDRPEHLR